VRASAAAEMNVDADEWKWLVHQQVRACKMAKHKTKDARRAEELRESGRPGGGQGRRDEVGGSGVYPKSAENIPGDAVIRTPQQWGQGERGAEGYEDSGGSELVQWGDQLLGGLTSDASGRPTIDIHGGDRPERYQEEQPGGEQEGSAEESTSDHPSDPAKRKWGRGTYGAGGLGGERMGERHERKE